MVMVQLCQEFIDALKQCGPAIVADCKIVIYFALLLNNKCKIILMILILNKRR
jgi:hypothetical protein